MRLIDADKLKEIVRNSPLIDFTDDDIFLIIDNAPSIPLPDFKAGYKQAIIDGKTNFSRPHCDNCDLYFIAKTKEEMQKGGNL